MKFNLEMAFATICSSNSNSCLVHLVTNLLCVVVIASTEYYDFEFDHSCFETAEIVNVGDEQSLQAMV